MTTEFLYPTKKPKILLINFEESDEEVLKAKNYNVERGWAAKNAHFFPSPGYEYDIVIARFDDVGYEASRKLSQYGMMEDDDYDQLAEKLNGSGFVLAFAEDESMGCYSLRQCGIEDVDIIDLDSRDTKYEIVSSSSILDGHQFACSILKRVAGDIVLPMARGLEWRKNLTNPIFALSFNGARKITSCIGYNKGSQWNEEKRQQEDTYALRFVVLPSLTKGYVRVATDFLSQLPNWRPDLFPPDSNYSWLEDRRYWSDEVISAESEINKEVERFEKKIEELQEERNNQKAKDQYLKQLLIADDGDEFEAGNKLTDASKLALEYLGFSVENTEKDTTTGKRREDLVCRDTADDFLALVECKGTVNPNPPESYASQLLNHMLVSKTQRGILIVNHDRKRDAFSRTLLYEDATHLWKDNENITIVSTVELFKLLRKTQKGECTREEARLLLKIPGRLEIT